MWDNVCLDKNSIYILVGTFICSKLEEVCKTIVEY